MTSAEDRTSEERKRITEAGQRAAAKLPPLTEEQARKVAALLSSVRRTEDRPSSTDHTTN